MSASPRTYRRCALAVPLLSRPVRRFSAHKHRDLGGIHPHLALTLNDLMTGEAPWPLFLHGPSNAGKTCAGLALTDWIPHSKYTTAAALTTELHASFRDKAEYDWVGLWGPYQEREYDRPRGASLVVLDELGTRNYVTDPMYEAVQQLLDVREGQPLVVISNHDIEGVHKLFDDRIARRCSDGVRVELPERDDCDD
jgi:DNA replication protein DnaC